MRILAIGDIHDCPSALDTLLAAVAPTADDTLVTLGDYVDRGLDSPASWTDSSRWTKTCTWSPCAATTTR